MKHNTLFIVRTSALVIFGLIILVYSIFQAHKLISGPIINIYTPQNGATYNQTLIEITGKAENIAYINMNGKRIFTDKDGNFKEKILLFPGYNVIKFDASDKFNSTIEKRLELILKE